MQPTYMVFVNTINAYIYIHAHSYIEDRITDACPTCAPTFAHVSAPKRASPFRRCGLRAARLAGVRLGGFVQRGHRRVEHRVGHHIARCMRRFSAGGRATAADALGRSSMRQGGIYI